MYLRKYWDVLLVDDEPDVLAVSRLALKNIRVYDIPLKIHEFTNKTDAIQYFQKRGELPDLALAILDVVMETDKAGLELCDYIRNTSNNRVTTIVVRTGQPGVAPERDVTDQYDINEYISKVEATEDKLHHIAKTAVRQFLYARCNEGMLNWVTRFSASKTRAELKQDVVDRINSVRRAVTGESLGALSAEMGFFMEGEYAGVGEFAETGAAKAKRKEILETPPAKLTESMTSPAGDRYMRLGNHVLMQVSSKKAIPVELIARVNYTPMPGYFVSAFWTMMNGLSNNWERLR